MSVQVCDVVRWHVVVICGMQLSPLSANEHTGVVSYVLRGATASELFDMQVSEYCGLLKFGGRGRLILRSMSKNTSHIPSKQWEKSSESASSVIAGRGWQGRLARTSEVRERTPPTPT
ncbi:hypothetical protein J6590_091089, partial [Homalodisca vitripennis]